MARNVGVSAMFGSMFYDDEEFATSAVLEDTA